MSSSFGATATAEECETFDLSAERIEKAIEQNKEKTKKKWKEYVRRYRNDRPWAD